MSLVLCKLLGAGTQRDPHRVGFPTYQLVAHDPASKLALVEVRDDDVPAGCPAVRFDAPWLPDGPVQAVRLRAADRDGWNAALRARYPKTHADVDVRNLVAPDA